MTTATQTAYYPVYPYYWYPPATVFVGAPVYTQVITLTGPPAVQITQVQIAPAYAQTVVIDNIYYGSNVIMIRFHGPHPVECDFDSSVQPVAIYADSVQLVQVTSAVNLTPTSNAWVYVPSTQVIQVDADPSTLTIFFTQPSQANTSSASTSSAMNATAAAPVAAAQSTIQALTTTSYAVIGVLVAIIAIIIIGAYLAVRKKRP
ncbi:MAG TPA: hypothetical protein VLV31_04055 [Candidatus Acidoferrales bacterium]|nr:hypothetical protein [Candidatus Acidoferrales bacterium]